MVSISTISMAITMVIVSWLSISLPLSIVPMVSIPTITMRISMMIVSRGSLCFPLAIVTVMAVSTIRVSIPMMIIPGLSISFSNGSWLSLSLAVVAMMTITSISMATVAM